jgi:hypothetical protein
VLDDPMTRLALIAVAAAVLVMAVRMAGHRRPTEQEIDLAGLGLPPGLVLFTSTDCANCAAARTQLAVAGLRPREVTWELEPGIIARAGVTATPLAVVVDGDGKVLDQWSGVPPRWWVSRAAAAARKAAPG